MEKYLLTYAIIGCAMKVYNSLGKGFVEVIPPWSVSALTSTLVCVQTDQPKKNFFSDCEDTIRGNGLLINFGFTSLQYELIFNPKFNHSVHS